MNLSLQQSLWLATNIHCAEMWSASRQLWDKVIDSQGSKCRRSSPLGTPWLSGRASHSVHCVGQHKEISVYLIWVWWQIAICEAVLVDHMSTTRKGKAEMINWFSIDSESEEKSLFKLKKGAFPHFPNGHFQCPKQKSETTFQYKYTPY